MIQTADYIILGGGLAGVSTAYWLQHYHPQRSILLLEREHLAFGASGRNAGFLTCGSLNYLQSNIKRWNTGEAVALWRFAEQNLHLLHEHILDHILQSSSSESLSYQKHGSLTLTVTQELLQNLKATVQLARLQGLDVEEVSNLPPALRGFAGGYLFRGDAAIEPARLVEAIAQRARLTWRKATVETLTRRQNLWQVTTDTGPVQAPQVVVCGNGYSAEFFPPLKSLIQPVRAQALLSQPVAPGLILPNVYVSDRLVYFRQKPTGEIIAGGLRTLDLEHEVGTEDFINPLIQGALDEFLKQHLNLSLTVSRRWSGVMGFTQSGLPLIGDWPQYPGLSVLAGFSGHGMGLAFHGAKVLVESWSGGSIPKPFLLSDVIAKSASDASSIVE